VFCAAVCGGKGAGCVEDGDVNNPLKKPTTEWKIFPVGAAEAEGGPCGTVEAEGCPCGAAETGDCPCGAEETGDCPCEAVEIEDSVD